ncbi:YeiH family protein [Microbacterium karelineae]|uniref:YeiH family protein n=1 Tax=Microbacterium karelineae TaxID=2654283 RepID=UPI0012EA6483|nr:putative sulfate exporter family transporter [Microbacterium karelineae]
MSLPVAARARSVAPGLALCTAIAATAAAIGALVPVAGSALPAIVLGVAIALVRVPSRILAPGIAAATGPVLRIAIVILGAQLSLGAIARVGAAALPVMIASLAACFAAAPLLRRALGVERRLGTLIGVGTGICGASAIAAVAPVIGASGATVSYAMSTIFLFNLAAIAAFPLLGHALGLEPEAFGLLAGTAINDTSSVVAAAGVYGTAALGFAVAVKLVRTLAIIPVSLTLSIAEARRTSRGERLTPVGAARLVPWFLVGFLAVAFLRTAGWIPDPIVGAAPAASGFLIALALAGIGLSTDLDAIRRAGWRPLALGAILSILVTATTLIAMRLTDALG